MWFEIDQLNDEINAQQEEIDGLNQQLQDKDTQLKELGKLSAGVAKKSSADDVAKAIRIYLNTSKRKTQSKREAAKTVLLELITAAKLSPQVPVPMTSFVPMTSSIKNIKCTIFI